MFDLGVAVVSGRQTLSVMKRSLRSAAPPIEIEIAADNRDAAVKAVRKKQQRPKAALLAASERAQSYAISELSR